MIATEAAAEGINLQFCSMVVNYDLPWNPQRIEQRIGRCHRYGQRYDVVVVNFLNKNNAADQRVYRAARRKIQAFLRRVRRKRRGARAQSNPASNSRSASSPSIRTAATTEEIETEFERLRDGDGHATSPSRWRIRAASCWRISTPRFMTA